MSAPLNHPLIPRKPLTVKDRLDHLLTKLEGGLNPLDDMTDEEKSQAEHDQALVAQAIKDVRAAESDWHADRVFVNAMATLAARGCERRPAAPGQSGLRRQIAAGQFTPAFEAAAQHLGMQGSPIPVRAAQQLTQVGGGQ